MSKRRINILGSTGSIGLNTLKVVEAHPEMFSVEVLTAYGNVDLLAEQAIKFKAKHSVIGDESLYNALKDALFGHDINCSAGDQAIIDAGAYPADITMAAIVGMAGLPSLMVAIKQGGLIALANKEPLVAAGPQVLEAVKQSGATLLPVDSEHNAIFQVYEQNNKTAIERIILTASGGPFREWSLAQMEKATPKQAVAHPNWTMGAKISVDSASMMNKALEVIEAHYLFDMPINKIEVLVHPQSVVHSMIEYSDGSVLSQMGASDMCTPITNILGWPNRIATPGDKLDLETMCDLSFEAVDNDRFPSIKMAYDALNSGQAACISMNAANEVAVAAFLDHKIAFLDIYKIIRQVMDKQDAGVLKSLNDVMSYDKVAREIAESLIS